MTIRSWRRMASLVAVAVVAASGTTGVPTTDAATYEQGREPESRIERPMADLGFLPPAPGSIAPRLLVIDAQRPTPGAARLAILERDRSWSEVSALEVALRPAENGAVRPVWTLDAPWMLAVDDRSVVVLANATVEDAAYLTHVTVARGEGGRDRLIQGARSRIPFRIDDAGVADVDGDGRPSLLLASARAERGDGSCQGTTILVLDPVSLATEATLELPAVRIAGAVTGRFDAVPGDDLFAYAYPNCPASPDTAVEARAMAVSLLDGSIEFDGRAATVTGFLGSPLRVDAADGRHAVVVRLIDGLALLEPGARWRSTGLAEPTARPLAAVATAGSPGSVVVAWMDIDSGDSAIRRARVADGVALTTSFALGTDMARQRQLIDSHDEHVRSGTPPVAFLGDTAGDGCPDLFVAGAILTCGETIPRVGAAWTATRPLRIFGEGASRRMIVASGVGWQEGRLPGVPAPAATEVAGWWRHGPSTPFVLAEVRAADATYFLHFPVPSATVDRVAGPAGTVDLPGLTGTRLLVRVGIAPSGATQPSGPSRDDFLQALAVPGERTVVTRVAVPPGVETGRDGGFAQVNLGPEPTGAGSWLVTVVPINDWGELGRPGVGIVARDVRPPSLEMAAPFTSPIWPTTAELPGIAEPGSTVMVNGSGPLELDGRGRFVIRETLLPWPRTFQLTATDPAGNVTAREVTVVGGVDYRQFPLQAILVTVLIVAALASGVFGSRRRRLADDSAGGNSADDHRWQDDGPGPEIEDLPSVSSGLTRR